MNKQYEQIDESLYSRQLYVLGHSAMESMSTFSVLICGMNGLGVEIAKNVILSGVKSVTIHDEHDTEITDLSSQYYLTEKDVGKNRAECTLPKLQQLNNYVNVDILRCSHNEIYGHVKEYDMVVLTNHDYVECINVNNYTRDNNVKFIMANTFGLMGYIFCDFNINFVVNDTNGIEPIHTLIDNIIIKTDKIFIKCIDEKPHKLEPKSYIRIDKIKGELGSILNGNYYEIEYIDAFKFNINLQIDTDIIYEGGGEITEIKEQKSFSFKKLNNCITDPPLCHINYFDFTRPYQLHNLFLKHNNLPYDSKYTDDQYINALFEHNIKQSNDICPINSIIGGMVAQEIIKGSTRKFTPIQQFLYYDAFECFTDVPHNKDELPDKTRYSNQQRLFGKEIQDKIHDSCYFIVGSGAIGCELLKNFAMMGLCTNSSLYVTDMDIIEKSNLNRQFLFGSKDIGKLKSITAKESIVQMNPDMKIIAHDNKVGIETENIYDYEFYSQLDGIINALDNVNARLYVDDQCIRYKKRLLESGTLGTKGNVQVILPYLTESYGSTSDPEEDSIPMCTVKNFPFLIEHCVEYVKEQFMNMFHDNISMIIETLNNNHKNNNYSQAFLKECGYIINNIPNNYDDCISFAHRHFCLEFRDSILNVLEKFPMDHISSTGEIFWKGNKKCPTPIEFDSNISSHIDYIVHLSSLWAQIFNITPKVANRDYIKEFINNNLINVTYINNFEEQDNIQINCKQLKKLGKIKSLHPIIFEKDDDSNHHIDYITVACNMRAQNYRIETADRYKVKQIAGKIIPAIATTTSIVAGLVSIELYKWIIGYETLDRYRNTFVNIALPYVGATEPVPVKSKKMGNIVKNIWDDFVFDKNITLNDLISHFSTEYELVIENICYGTGILYDSLLDVDIDMNSKVIDLIDHDIQNYSIHIALLFENCVDTLDYVILE